MSSNRINHKKTIHVATTVTSSSGQRRVCELFIAKFLGSNNLLDLSPFLLQTVRTSRIFDLNVTEVIRFQAK